METFSVYAIDNKGLTENVDSELSHDEAKMLSGINKLYPGFRNKHWYDSNSDTWHYDEKDFVIKINAIKLNVFGEL